MYDAVMQQDVNLVLANNMFISALVLVGMAISDILLAVVDPRIRYGKEGGLHAFIGQDVHIGEEVCHPKCGKRAKQACVYNLHVASR